MRIELRYLSLLDCRNITWDHSWTKDHSPRRRWFFLCCRSSAGAAASKAVQKYRIYHLRSVSAHALMYKYEAKRLLCFYSDAIDENGTSSLPLRLSRPLHDATQIHFYIITFKTKRGESQTMTGIWPFYTHTALKCKANTMWFMQPWPLKHVFCLLLLFVLHPVLPSPCYFHRKWNRRSQNALQLRAAHTHGAK